LSQLCLAISTYWLQSILQGLCTLSLRITEWTEGSHVITRHPGYGWYHEYVGRCGQQG